MDQKSLERIVQVEPAVIVEELSKALGTTVVFAKGALDTLSTLPLPGKKALVVAYNESFVKPTLDRVLAQLDKAGIAYAIYSKITPNPVVEIIDEGGQFLRENGCDFVVALGGGGVIDCGKNIAIMATNEGSIWDYVQMGSGGHKPIVNDPLPIVTIPTTAGTGSEVNWGSSFSKEQTNEKIALKEERLLPKVTVIDPELTYSIPPSFTAYQGWDALTHSMEYLINKNQDDTCDYFARQAVRLAGRALARAVAGEEDARADMALASALSGYVIGHCGTSSQHALECAISGFYPKLAHGAGMLMLSKEYFALIIEKGACDDVFVDMAQLMGKEDASAPQAFLEVIDEIQKASHVDALKMSDYSIDPGKFQEMVDFSRFAMGYSHALDRIPLTDEECMQVFNKSYL